MIYLNRFTAAARLGQTWTVDMVSRMIDIKLDWMRKNQALIRSGEGIDSTGDSVPEEPPSDDAREKARVIMAGSVTGGARHLKQLAKQSLAVVAQGGSVTEFDTLTTNEKWREIQEMLPPGQTAFDRPDIVARVFHAKLQAYLANLKNGYYHGATLKQTPDGLRFYHGNFTGGKAVIYIMRVIEYQHRGLPHAHIVYKIEGAPECPLRDDTAADKRRKLTLVQEYIDGGKVVEGHSTASRVEDRSRLERGEYLLNLM